MIDFKKCADTRCANRVNDKEKYCFDCQRRIDAENRELYENPKDNDRTRWDRHHKKGRR